MPIENGVEPLSLRFGRAIFICLVDAVMGIGRIGLTVAKAMEGKKNRLRGICAGVPQRATGASQASNWCRAAFLKAGGVKNTSG